MDFTNKVVLVTGASSGIGEATALLFAKYGAKLAIVAKYGEEESLEDVRKQCEGEKGEEPLVIVADLATDEGCERTAMETLKHFGRLDVLINNAGVGVFGTIQYADMQTFDRVFAINVRAVFNMTRLLVPALIESKGKIINVSGITDSAMWQGALPYSMSKAAISHFTQLIALELAPKGVRVNAVCPGLTDTQLTRRMANCTDEQYVEYLNQRGKKIPLGKVCKPENVSKMITYLASDDCELVTGILVPVDGALRLLSGGID